jgi:magnesium transporter
MPPAGPVSAPVLRGLASTNGQIVPIDSLEALAGVLRDPAATVWIDVTAPDGTIVGEVGALLDLHPLIAEDIVERNQRAKFEEIGGTIHIVMFSVRYENRKVSTVEVDLVLGQRSLLTAHEGQWDPFVLAQLHNDAGATLKRGPDYLLYALTDGLVDELFPVMDAVEDEIDDLQDDVIRDATPATLERLFALKRELIGLRRATSPARDIFNQLTNRDLALVSADHIVYFRDVYDHLIRVTDELDNDRDLVAGTLDVYLSTINNNLSVIMKRLTGVTVIVAGIGAIAGIFGMSEAGAAIAGTEAAGFWLVIAAMLALAVGLFWVLHRVDWI